MKRWITVNPFDGSQTYDYELPKKEWDDSIVDRSHFIPVAEALKNLEGNSASMHADLTRFDFKDGIQNSFSVRNQNDLIIAWTLDVWLDCSISDEDLFLPKLAPTPIPLVMTPARDGRP